MKKTVARIHIGIFLTWVIWCFYRGVLCSLTLLPDVLAPESFSTDYVLFSFVLLASPLLAPFVTVVTSMLCLLGRVGHWGVSLFIFLFSCATIAFRIGWAEVYLPWRF